MEEARKEIADNITVAINSINNAVEAQNKKHRLTALTGALVSIGQSLIAIAQIMFLKVNWNGYQVQFDNGEPASEDMPESSGVADEAEAGTV